MLTIYGSPRTSAGRCFWCLEEVGTPYQHKTINFKEEEHKSAEFLAINPNGKIPALVDGDFTLWESVAINFYLADKYKPELLSDKPEERGLISQWSLWSMVDLQVPMIDIFIQKVFVPDERRDQSVIDKALKKLPDLLGTLERGLEDRKYLLGDRFSLADLNVASVAMICEGINYDLKDYPAIKSWLGHVTERPAYQRYMALRGK